MVTIFGVAEGDAELVEIDELPAHTSPATNPTEDLESISLFLRQGGNIRKLKISLHFDKH